MKNMARHIQNQPQGKRKRHHPSRPQRGKLFHLSGLEEVSPGEASSVSGGGGEGYTTSRALCRRAPDG